MHRGARAKPTSIKIIEGNRGHRPLTQNLLDPGPDMPEPPAHLDNYAREAWERYAPGLLAMRVLSRVDETIFASFCVSYSRWRHAEEELNKLAESMGTPIVKLVTKTTGGNYIQNVLVGISNRAMKNMQSFANELGMTPSARAHLDLHGVGHQQRGKFDGLIGVCSRTRKEVSDTLDVSFR
jgi:P27 family predicted phage terminase small subunit